MDLTAIPPDIRELLLYAVPFVIIAFFAAAALFLARDLLGKPTNGNGRRNGNGNGHYRNTNGNGNGRRSGNGNGNGNGKSGNGGGHYAPGHEMAIPTLAQPTALEGGDVGSRMENWFSRLLYECGAPFTRDVAFMTELAGGLAVGGTVLLLTDNLILGVLGFVGGTAAVIGIYLLVRGRRQRIIREQLPDLIDHLARAVRAGQTVDQALHLVGETSPDPLGVEFRRCSGQINMGLSVDAAMRSLSRRVPIPEMRILASTFVVQRRAGGSLPLTLERLAKVIRDRISYFRQYRAATAGSRFSMAIIALAGPLVAAFMMYYRPEMFDMFFQSQTGWLAFFTAIACYVIGVTWAYFIMKTDY